MTLPICYAMLLAGGAGMFAGVIILDPDRSGGSAWLTALGVVALLCAVSSWLTGSIIGLTEEHRRKRAARDQRRFTKRRRRRRKHKKRMAQRQPERG